MSKLPSPGQNFYGTLSVIETDADSQTWRAYSLIHGPTLHGSQFRSAAKRLLPTAYYAHSSGVGLAILHHPRRRASLPDQRRLRVGIVGLGVGTLAAYGQPGDYFRFYEINPDVPRISGSEFFSYLRDSSARVGVVLGDARLSMETDLERHEPQQFDVLAVDAFSGEAIPVHLLTKEAFEIYLQHLRKPDGVLAVNIRAGLKNGSLATGRKERGLRGKEVEGN